MNERVQKGTEAEPRGLRAANRSKKGSEEETRWLEMPQLVRISMCVWVGFFL